MSDFWVLIGDSTNTVKYGEVHSSPRWSSTNGLDAAGTFQFELPAADPICAQLTAKRIVTCYTLVSGLQTEVGSGIIDNITLALDGDGNPTGMVSVTGSSRLRELVYRHVGPLLVSNGGGGSTLNGPQQIIALAPAGWTLDVVSGANVTTKAVYHQYQDESVLTSFVKLAGITGEHFRAGAGQKIVWLNFDLWQASNASGVRAFYNADPLSIDDNEDGAIVATISRTTNSYDYFVGRTYAYGVGDGSGRVSLSGSVNPVAWSADWVQGNDSKGYYLQHTPTWNSYGIESVAQWKDEASAQTLLETAYEYMRRSQNPVEQYSLGLRGLKTTLQPGTTIRLVAHEYVDGYHAINIDADLVIMSVTDQVDDQGLRTVALTCSTVDKYADSDVSIMADQMVEAQNFYTHNQPNGTLIGLATSITAGKTLTLAASTDVTATFPITGTVAMGAGTNTVSTTNDVTVAAHTHAAASSSNPGAAASLLATDGSGYTTVQRLGVGSATPTFPIDVTGTGVIRVDDNKTNNTNKTGYFVVSHYAIANNPFSPFFGFTGNGTNYAYIGGGGAYLAATLIRFYTAANSTTSAGTERARIASNGLFSAYFGLTVSGGVTTTAGRRQAVATKAANYTLTTADEVVVFTATATALLPAATGTGQTYRICNEGAAGVVLTIDASGAETIKGALTQVLYPGEDLILTDYATGKWA